MKKRMIIWLWVMAMAVLPVTVYATTNVVLIRVGESDQPAASDVGNFIGKPAGDLYVQCNAPSSTCGTGAGCTGLFANGDRLGVSYVLTKASGKGTRLGEAFFKDEASLPSAGTQASSWSAVNSTCTINNIYMNAHTVNY